MAKVEMLHIEPTKVLSATKGNTNVAFKLYGEVTEERLAKEQAELKRRVEQLS